jgi:hypothetical protein
MFPRDSITMKRPSPLTAPANDSDVDEVSWVTKVSAWAKAVGTRADKNINAVIKVRRNFTNPPKLSIKANEAS